MTTSDFPLLFGDNLYRMLLGQYNTWDTKTYPKYTKIVERQRLPRAQHVHDGRRHWRAPANRLNAVNILKLPSKKASIPVKVAKFGERFSLTFEMMINDDLNAFRDQDSGACTGCSFNGRAACHFACSPHRQDPSTALYTTGNKNIVPSNPPLTISGLQSCLHDYLLAGEYRWPAHS